MAATRESRQNPFAALSALRDALPPGETAQREAAKPAETPSDPVVALLARRVVVRRERKGRGGKTVTVVQCAEGGDEAALEALARELRKALGTAAHREEGAVIVGGDIDDRVADWLSQRGARRVTRG